MRLGISNSSPRMSKATFLQGVRGGFECMPLTYYPVEALSSVLAREPAKNTEFLT